MCVCVCVYYRNQGQVKCNIEQHDRDGFSPLLIAACKGNTEAVKVLIRRGANIREKDKNDKSALYWAAEENNVEVMKVTIYCADDL